MFSSLVAIALAASVSGQSCGCTADESCCQDNKGYACCIDQIDYCVAPNASGTKEFPARCCPQWTVGCDIGSVGCCDPARPWQRTIDATAARKAGATGAAGASRWTSPSRAGAGVTVYALFVVGTGMEALVVDAATGTITSLTKVLGPASTYFSKLYGAATRVYPFDPTRSKFFFLDIDQQHASASSQITLYSVDPADGSSTATPVTGAKGFIMSFEYHPESATMVVAVGDRKSPEATFYSVDLGTAAATEIGTVARGDFETTAAYYSAYISAVGSDGKSVLRLGYKSVSTGTIPGLGITPLSGGGTASWNRVAAPASEEFYYSLVRPSGGDSFLSLAPSAAFNHTFAVVEWTTGSTAIVIANIADAHPPETPQTGILGYVADDANAQNYVAMTVRSHPSVLPGLKDRWEVVMVDRAAKTGTSVPMSGHNFDPLGAETISCSGVGIAK